MHMILFFKINFINRNLCMMSEHSLKIPPEVASGSNTMHIQKKAGLKYINVPK